MADRVAAVDGGRGTVSAPLARFPTNSRNYKAIDGNIIDGVAQLLPSRLRRGQFHGVYQCMGVEESTGRGGD